MTLTLSVGMAVAPFDHLGDGHGNSFLTYRIPVSTYFDLSLVPLSGWFVGFFLVGLRSREVAEQTVVPRVGAGGSNVEVQLADQWLPATLTAWDTRNVGLFAHVRCTHDGQEHDEWVSAELVRRPLGAGPLGASEPRLTD